MPWNFFISVSDYWMYKYRNVTEVNYESANLTTDVVLTPLQKEWNSYLSIASMVPRVGFLVINAAFGSTSRDAIQRNIFEENILYPYYLVQSFFTP